MTQRWVLKSANDRFTIWIEIKDRNGSHQDEICGRIEAWLWTSPLHRWLNRNKSSKEPMKSNLTPAMHYRRHRHWWRQWFLKQPWLYQKISVGVNRNSYIESNQRKTRWDKEIIWDEIRGKIDEYMENISDYIIWFVLKFLIQSGLSDYVANGTDYDGHGFITTCILRFSVFFF